MIILAFLTTVHFELLCANDFHHCVTPLGYWWWGGEEQWNGLYTEQRTSTEDLRILTFKKHSG